MSNLCGDVARREWDTRARRAPPPGHDAVVSRLRVSATLAPHQGCVNTVEWSDGGGLLVTGSDDRCVNVYRSATAGDAYPLQASLRSGHSRNVFCAKFVPHSGDDEVATTAADGQVRLLRLSRAASGAGSGAPPGAPRCLFDGRGAGMGMKLAFLPRCPSAFLTTHQDGAVRLFDTRAPAAASSTATAASAPTLTLATLVGAASDVAFDPARPERFAVGCADPYVRLFDLRMAATSADALALPTGVQLAARHVAGGVARALAGRPGRHLYRLEGVSGLAWAPRGNTLYASYRGEDVYALAAGPGAAAAAAAEDAAAAAALDDHDGGAAPVAACAATLRRYRGRRNEQTFLKGLAVLCDGAYVAAGGDCGHVFVWHAPTGALAARVRADASILNAVAPHPHGLPLLAVSGIDEDAKVLAPGDGRAHAWQAPRGNAAAAAAAHSTASPSAAMRQLQRGGSSEEEDEDGGGSLFGADLEGDDEDELFFADMADARAFLARLRRHMVATRGRHAHGSDSDSESDADEDEDEADESGDSDGDEDGGAAELAAEGAELDSDEGGAQDAPPAAAADEAAAVGRRRARGGAAAAALDGVAEQRSSPRQRREN